MPGQRHPDNRRVEAYLDRQLSDMLGLILQHRHQPFSLWLRGMISQCALEHDLPDARLVQVMLPRPVIRDLRDVLRSRGQTLSVWFRAMVDRCAAERLPESQGDVKKIIPHQVAQLAREALLREYQLQMEIAARGNTPEERKKMREDAGKVGDAADWFADVEEERRLRLHVLESGQRAPRHRTKAGANPETDSTSSATDAPIG
ncbi:MAG TPA: hypothetical protein VGK74_22275 [Symbiobacteriaceae bacterium]|jgi:hypothetical protein